MHPFDSTLLSHTLNADKDRTAQPESIPLSPKEPKRLLGNTSPASHRCYSQVKQHIVLRTDTQVLPDDTELRADIFAQDEGCTRGWGEQASQDGPEGQTQQISKFHHQETSAAHAMMDERRVGSSPGELPRQESTEKHLAKRLKKLAPTVLTVIKAHPQDSARRKYFFL